MKTLKEILKKKMFYAYIIFILLMGGCKKSDWYDVKSDKTLSVPTSLVDLQALLDNGRVMNTGTPCMGEIASDDHYLTDARAASLTGFSRNAYTWSHEQKNINVPDWINGTASGSYKRIYYANLVLEGVEKIITPSNDQQWLDGVKGQAFFHRGHAFYELSQVFAEPYESNKLSGRLGIPLRLKSDVGILSVRSTLMETYNQIIDDLMRAKDLLPLKTMYKTRPSKSSVFALLARVYLSMGNYENAEMYAGLCLQDYSTLMDYKLFNVSGITNPIMAYNSEVIFYSSMLGGTALSFNNIMIDTTFYNAFNDNDLRKTVLFNRDATTRLVTYKGTYCGAGIENPFSGLAVDEVYLIRAECYARAGKILDAMNDLNTLISKRWDPNATIPPKQYANITAINKEDALQKVLEERKKELIMRGVRWSDLRRLNQDPKFAIKFSRTVGGKTYTLEPNSHKYTFPIPDDIIEITKMEQNPGW